MSQKTPFNTPLFWRGAVGGLIGTLITYAALWTTKALTPLGTVVVPLLTLTVTTILAYLYARHKSKAYPESGVTRSGRTTPVEQAPE